MQTINEYNLSNHIGVCVLDNATNNDTAVRDLTTKLSGFDELTARCRCAAHILNLAVRAFLSAGTCDEKFDEFDSDNDNKKWKRFPSVEALHNLAKLIRNSPIYRQKYGHLINQLSEFNRMIQSENDTRWDTVHQMIDSVRGKRSVIEVFLKDLELHETDTKKRNKIAKSMLSDEHWKQLDEIYRILEPFKICSERFQCMYRLK